MIFSKFGLPILAAASAFVAFAEGREALAVLTAKPLMEGIGIYEQPVTAGETVLVDWSIFKYTQCEGALSRVWSSDDFFLAEPHKPTALPEGATNIKIPTVIPEFVEAGPLEMQVKGYFDCPGEGRRYFSLTPVEFEVTG